MGSLQRPRSLAVGEDWLFPPQNPTLAAPLQNVYRRGRNTMNAIETLKSRTVQLNVVAPYPLMCRLWTKTIFLTRIAIYHSLYFNWMTFFSVSINDMLCYVTIIILVPYLYWLKQHDPWHHKPSHILDIEASKATISGGDHDGQRKVRRVNCEQLGE